MAKGFAIHNALTTHGGRIPSTQQRSSQMGNLFLRADDGHYCPQCQCWSKIIKSHDHIIFDGKSVAYAGDLLTCGARILPQQSHVVGDSQGSYYRSSNNSISQSFSAKETFSDKFFFIEQGTGNALPNIVYRVHRENGEIEEGITDKNGYTADISNSEKAERIRIEIVSKDFDLEGFLNANFR